MKKKQNRPKSKSKEYILLLTNEDWVRIYFSTERGILKKFVVQYYSLIDGRKRSIMRIDTCHGYPHRHTYYRNKKEANVVIGSNIDQVFTEAKSYVIKNFRKIRDNYLSN